MLLFITLALSPWLIGSTWSAFYAYQGLGNDARMAFIADFYHHTFSTFTEGELSLPAFDFDPTVLWNGAWGEFIEMWDFGELGIRYHIFPRRFHRQRQRHE